MIAVYRKGELIRLSEGHAVNVLAKMNFIKVSLQRARHYWA